jgi:hypothetical protein
MSGPVYETGETYVRSVLDFLRRKDQRAAERDYEDAWMAQEQPLFLTPYRGLGVYQPHEAAGLRGPCPADCACVTLEWAKTRGIAEYSRHPNNNVSAWWGERWGMGVVNPPKSRS